MDHKQILLKQASNKQDNQLEKKSQNAKKKEKNYEF